MAPQKSFEGFSYFQLASVVFPAPYDGYKYSWKHLYHRFTDVLLSRFFLNLRETGVAGSSQTSPSQFYDVQSSRGVGSLGGTISFMRSDSYQDGELAVPDESGALVEGGAEVDEDVRADYDLSSTNVAA